MMAHKRMSFDQACHRYVHRYTMDFVPCWARQPCNNGRYYAPQFTTDREWYDNTTFPGEAGHPFKSDCYTKGQTWPLGQWLDKPYHRDDFPGFTADQIIAGLTKPTFSES